MSTVRTFPMLAPHPWRAYPSALLGGIDMPTKEELLAHSHTDTNEIAKVIGADKIFYQDLIDLEVRSTTSPHPNPDQART